MEEKLDLNLYSKIIKAINEISKTKDSFTTYDIHNEFSEDEIGEIRNYVSRSDMLNKAFNITSGMIRKRDMKYFERKIGVSKLLEELEIIDDYILVLSFKKRDVSLWIM